MVPHGSGPPPALGSLWMENTTGDGPLRVKRFDADWVRLEGERPWMAQRSTFRTGFSPWPKPKQPVGSRFRRRARPR